MHADSLRIRLKCGSCGKCYSLKAELAGKKAQCTCGARVTIPAAPAPATASSSSIASGRQRQPALPDEFFSGTGEFAPAEEFAAVEIDEHIFDAEPIPEFDERDFEMPSVSDELQLEAPVQRHVPASIRQAVDASRATTVRIPQAKSSWLLKFVGVYGFVLMGGSALLGALNLLGAFGLALQREVTLGAAAVLAIAVGLQSLIFYCIFRLGRGIVDGERSAVMGLVAIYLLTLIVAGLVALTFPEAVAGSVVLAVVSTFVFAPPIIAAYFEWDGLHGSDD